MLRLLDPPPSKEEPRGGKSQKHQHNSNVESACTRQYVHDKNECEKGDQEQVQRNAVTISCLPDRFSVIGHMSVDGID